MLHELVQPLLRIHSSRKNEQIQETFMSSDTQEESLQEACSPTTSHQTSLPKVLWLGAFSSGSAFSVQLLNNLEMGGNFSSMTHSLEKEAPLCSITEKGFHQV